MNKLTRLLCASAVVLAATGCDKNYDIDNIDKTVEIKVNDLVIPLNIDKITLENVIDTSDDIQIVDGAYAYVSDGTFDSDPERFDPFEAKANKLSPSVLKLASNGMSLDYFVHEAALSDYEFKAENVTESVDDVTRVYGQITLNVTLNLADLKQKYSSLAISNAKLQLPPMCEIESFNYSGSYDSATGVVSLDPFTVSPLQNITFTAKASSVGVASGSFSDHTLTTEGQIGFIEGDFKLQSQGSYTPDFQPISIDISYSVPAFTATAIDGWIHYDIDGFDIPRVELNNLPDVLNQEGTNLKLANPMLYLQLTNPLRQYGVYATTGMEIEPMRDNQASHVLTLDSPTFYIGRGEPMQGEYYNYCLSPKPPVNGNAEFANAKHEPFSQLGNLLAGNGLPDAIEIKLVDPEVPSQEVAKFDLRGFDGIVGKYKFIAPFQFVGGSTVIYSKTDKDWDSEDLEKLTVTSLEISMDVTTDVPLAISLSGYPLGKDGKRIPDVDIKGANIPAMANNEKVTIYVDCPSDGFEGLNGIEFTAIATAIDGEPLSPNMTIELSNVRPKVGGHYTTTLD